MRIAVAGGTGVVGTLVVDNLRARGHEPVVLARAAGIDLVTGEGLADRLDGVEAVVDVTSTVTTGAKAATAFFTACTGNLLTEGARAGVEHHVLLSIVGIDVTPFGYYRGKLAQEQLVSDGPVASSTVRAPQFHEFAAQMIERASFAGVTAVPQMRSAPMAAAEVASVLADLAEGAPQGMETPLRGPREEQMVEMTRRLLRHRGSRRPVLGLRVPGKAGTAMRNGALVAADPAQVGVQTFDEWLGLQPGAGRAISS